MLRDSPEFDMATRRRTTLNLIVIVGGILVASSLLALLLFHLLNPNRYRSELIAYFEHNTGKKAEIAHLALTLFPKVTIHISGLCVKSPPPFPPGDVVNVAEADAVIDPWSLLHGAVVIRSLVLKDLAINLLSAPDGRWNFENPQATSAKNTFPMGIIDKVEIERAQLTVSNLLPSGSVGAAFVEVHDMASDLTIVNLAAIVNPSSPSLNGQGTWQASRVRVGAVETTTVKSTVRLESWNVSIADVKANAYSGTVTGNFSLSLATKNASITTDAQMSGIDLASLLAAFHEQRTGMTGTLEGDLNLAGEVEHTVNPLAGLHGTGHARVTNGQVPSLMSDPDISKLAPFNDQGPARGRPSSFASISADLQLADLWVASKAVDIDGFGLDVDGSGRVSVSGSDELDYRGVATITTKQGFWTNMFARLGGATLKDGKLSFPFRIGGTLEGPKVSRATAEK
jgi:uncharacterized protein involved in outer membrane biogenesis